MSHSAQNPGSLSDANRLFDANPTPTVEQADALAKAIEQKRWRVASALSGYASEDQLKDALRKLLQISREPGSWSAMGEGASPAALAAKAADAAGDSAASLLEEAGEFAMFFAKEVSVDLLRPPRRADNPSAQAFDASGEALATLFGRVIGLVRIADGWTPGNELCAAERFLRPSFATSTESRPSEQEAKMAAWAAERGAAGLANRALLAKVNWCGVSDETVARWARALSAHDASRPAAEKDFHGCGAWGDLAAQMVANGRMGAFRAMIKDAKELGLGEKIGLARHSLGAAARRIRQAEETKPQGDLHLWKKTLKEISGEGLPMGAVSLLGVAEHARRHAHRLANTLADERDILSRMGEDLDWVEKELGVSAQEASEFAEKNILFFAHNRGEMELAQAAIGWAAQRGAIPTPEAWVEATGSCAPLLAAMLDAWPREKPPGAALSTAAGAFTIGANNSLRLLAEKREWSAEERGVALRAAAATGSDCQKRFDLLVAGEEPVGAEAMSHALLALCSRFSLGHRTEPDAAVAKWAAEWIDRLGAGAKGPALDGSPLQAALKAESWRLAHALSERGGMGAKTVSWLLAARKSDSPELAPWKEKARAAKEASELSRALRRDAAQRKKAGKAKPAEAPVVPEPKKATRRL